jgi:cellulose synthase/poly-beta-1,6-N-acetylglucosamine synthase-like glycosyltransferase
MQSVMLSGIIVAIVCMPAILTIVWFAEIVAGCLALRRARPAAGATSERSHRTAVLIPAHNEGVGILPTLRDVQAQLGPADRVLVVADNCTDDTGETARTAGADVVIRHDPERRGKGYALEFGVGHLAGDPPDVVVILDADCRLGQGALSHLSMNAMASGRPIQSLYLMLRPEGVPSGAGVNVFAWRVKNWLRPLGQKLLGMPTQLFGTGMAFPFALLAGRDLGNSRLAEDTALGLALAARGHPPLFIGEARIHSYFPISDAGAGSQRHRWEKGHLDNIAELVPGALITSLRDRNAALAALAIDMAVPPLSLLVLITLLCLTLGGMAVALGATSATLAIPLFSALILGLGTALAWLAVGRDVLSVRRLLLLPLHPIRKLLFYNKIARGKSSSAWVRTDRK